MSEVMNRMTEEEYRADPGVNKSTLWEMRKSPKHYKWALENPTEDTPALRAGRAIHMAVLQMDEFDKHYVVGPAVDKRTKEGKAAWAAFMEDAGDREVLTGEEYAEIMAIADAVKAETSDLFKQCKTEVPLFWDDRRTGIRCKCRVDAMLETDDKLVLIDLKTTTDASVDAFARSAVRYGYHVQAAHYMNGAEACGLNHGKPIMWWFVAVEKNPPYAVNLIQVTDGFLTDGQFVLMGLMDKLDECLRNDVFPGYGVSVLDMPAWAIREEE